MAGLPGSGKSTVADALAGRLAALVVSVDLIEDAMLGAGITRGWTSGVAAYEVAGSIAAHNLALGSSVIVDSVSDSQAARQTWWRAAEVAHAPVAIVAVRCSDEREHRRRLEARQRGLGHLPEPSWADVQRRAQQFAPWVEQRLVVDTVHPLDAVVLAVLKYVGKPATRPRRTGSGEPPPPGSVRA